MRLPRIIALLLALASGALHAQTLQHRPSANVEATPAPSALTDARQALPRAAEGEYRWGEPGEVIELYVENDALRGYMTRRSERGSAASAPMTFTFAQAGVNEGKLNFRTRSIHGDWYSFKGQVVRGPAASRALEGYYVLEGTLALHLERSEPEDQSAPGQPLSRQVTLKLAAVRHPLE